MALDFPSSPVNGQIYDNYYYDSVMGTWRAQGSGLALNAFVNPTITGGTISGLSTDLAVADGGTGASTLTGYVKGNGTSAFTAQTIPIPVSDGGTGATTAVAALSNLGAAALSGASFTGGISGTSASFSGQVSGTQVIGTTPNNNGSTGGLAVKAPAGGSQTSGFLQFVNNAYSAQWGYIEATSAGTMNISATYVKVPNQPAFAIRGTSDTAGNATAYVRKFNQTTDYNVGSCYNATTGRFTAPIAGKYFISFMLFASGTANRRLSTININGTGYLEVTDETTADTYTSLSGSYVLNLAANDYVTISSTAPLIGTSSIYAGFFGYLLG